MDDTGLPTSMSRDRTTPSIGERIVALVELLLGPVDRRLRLRDGGARLRHARLGDAQLRPGDRLAVDRLLERAPRVVHVLLRDQLVARELFGALDVAAGERDVGALGLDLVLVQLGLGGLQVGVGAGQRGLRLAQPRREVVAVQLGQHLALGRPRSPTSTFSSLMMPLAFDLISTFVIGSILPVATTERARSPRSTVARRDGSIVAARAGDTVYPTSQGQMPTPRVTETTLASIS